MINLHVNSAVTRGIAGRCTGGTVAWYYRRVKRVKRVVVAASSAVRASTVGRVKT